MAKPPNTAERAFLAHVQSLPCLACGRWGVHVHHVTSDGYKRITKRHDRVVPLCPDCHQHNAKAVHKLGHAAFNEMHKIDLMAEAERIWREYDDNT